MEIVKDLMIKAKVLLKDKVLENKVIALERVKVKMTMTMMKI
jgi:hypothetical protein